MAGLRSSYGKVWVKNGIVAELKCKYGYVGVKDGKLGNKMAELRSQNGQDGVKNGCIKVPLWLSWV